MNKSFYIILFLLIYPAYSLLSQNEVSYDDSLKSLFKQSRNHTAKAFLIETKNEVTQLGDSMLAEWYIYYSFNSMLLDEKDSSIYYLTEAIRLTDKNNLSNLNFKANVEMIELYRSMRLYKEALFQIRILYPKLFGKEPSLICRYYHRSAAVYNEANYTNHQDSYLDTAIQLSKKALEISIRNGYRDYQAVSYNELGNIYERLGKMDSALIFYKKSIHLWGDGNILHKTNALKNIGGYYLRRKLPDSSIYFFKKIIKQSKDKLNHQILADIYWGLTKANEMKGDSMNCMKYKLLDAHHNSLGLQEKLERKTMDLSIAYQSKKKDLLIKEGELKIKQEVQNKKYILIILIIITIASISLIYFYLISQKKNKKLHHLLKENEFLVGESNHRIKNNLQLIISLIGRELYKDEKGKEDLKEISDKITSIATLHQHLYINESKERIQIKDYLYSIVENFSNLNYFENIELKLEIEQLELLIEQSVYLGLLITELITNSIKHAFINKKQGKNFIKMVLTKESKNYTFIYEDNGVGLEKEESPALVILLCKQLKGKTLIDTEKGKGFKLRLTTKI